MALQLECLAFDQILLMQHNITEQHSSILDVERMTNHGTFLPGDAELLSLDIAFMNSCAQNSNQNKIATVIS